MTSRFPDKPQRARTSCKVHCALSSVNAPMTPPAALIGPLTTAMISNLNEVRSENGEGLTKRNKWT